MDVPTGTACFVAQVRFLELPDDATPLGNVSSIIQPSTVDDPETSPLSLEYPDNEGIIILVRDEIRGIPDDRLFHVSFNNLLPPTS